MTTGNLGTSAITGAIFDCDGTLVDSMGMWNAIVEDAFDAHDIPKTPELLAEAEAFNFDDMCFWFHDRFGIGESGEAVLAELREIVRGHYVNDIPLFEGCRSFLDELSQAGVRMLILSATTEAEVRVALRAHGIDGYFERVIQTSETGSDKEHPEAYRYAIEALGTDPETTWVFEDAPFAVRTAHEMGLKTVCLYNDHDGRDFDFCQQNSDILAHGYGELSLALLCDYAVQSGPTDGVLRVLVVGGSPEPSSAELVARLGRECDYVVAADRGAEACRAAGLVPDVLCGDADSIDAETLVWAERESRASIRYPGEKYVTDLALAIACARHEAARRQQALELTFTCTSGGRSDHAMAVWGHIVAARDVAPRIVEDAFECRLLASDGTRVWKMGNEPESMGATVSVIPLPEAAVVSERGMRWNLDHRRLPALADEGLSNVIVEADAEVRCHEGNILVWLLR